MDAGEIRRRSARLRWARRVCGGPLLVTWLLLAAPAWGAVGGTWVTKAPLQGEGFAGSIIDGKIYVSHGNRPGDSAALSIYDMAADSWSAGPSASVARSELVGASAGGRHYAIGGRPAQSTVEIFDPAINSWSAGPPMPTARRGLGAATIRRRIFVEGGSTGATPHSGIPLSANEVFNTRTGTWRSRAPMPIPMMDVYATVAKGRKVYVFGGFDGTSVSGAVQIFRPATNSWTLGAPMPTPRSNAVAGVCGGRIFVIGGLDNARANLAVNEAYDPATNSWDTAPSKPTPGSEFAVGDVSTGTQIHAIGSGAFGAARNVHEVFNCPPRCPNGKKDENGEQDEDGHKRRNGKKRDNGKKREKGGERETVKGCPNGDDENGDDKNGDDPNGDDPNGDDENGDDENGDDENEDDEDGDDEDGDDENGDDENGDDDD